jgi:hypothetical protein
VIGTYASGIVICLAAIVLGRAICLLSGHDGSTWLAPAVGFAALMIVCQVAVSLPGHGWTAGVVVLVLCAVAVGIGARRHAGWPDPADLVPVAIAVLVITTVPFLANARVGVLGISVLNDTHWHLFLAQGLLDPSIRPLDDFGVGYPLGPQAVAAVFAQSLGTSVDRSLTGVLVATPILTGLTAIGLLHALRRTRRWLVAIAAAIPYLAAAWYVQSAFKEPIMSLLLLGLVLTLQTGRRQAFARPRAVAVPVVVLIAGVLYDYSYPGLIWPVAILACWLLLELLIGGGWRGLRGLMAGVRGALPALALAALVLLVLVAPDLNRMYMFWQDNGGSSVGTVGGVTTAALANLAGPLHTFEGFSVWLWGDFRFAPPGTLRADVLPGFAVAVLGFALVRALARRELPWVAAVAGFVLVYVYTKHAQSPYVAAKALAIPGPVLIVGSGAALLTPLARFRGRSLASLGLALAAVFFFVLSFNSDLLALRDAQVGPSDHTAELRSLRPLLHGRPTLVLFYDDYFKWELLGVPVSSPLFPSPTPVAVSAAKPWAYGQPLDFDSIDAAQLDRFDYVITTRTGAQSQPPANFHLVGVSPSYEVFRRVGPTPVRRVLPEAGHPGATLDCATAAGRLISRQRGVAAVRAAPVAVAVGLQLPGQSQQVQLRLARGRWQLSLPYVSSQAVLVRGGGLNLRLPPNLDRPGSLWPAGTVTSTGVPIILTLTVADPGVLFSGDPPAQYFIPQPLVAVPDTPERIIPLHAACGRYVDWYQLG